MNKKEARKKKHEREKKKAEILESEIIGDEEEETLLGNLAGIKQIPMIPWETIPPMTSVGTEILHIPAEAGGDWFEKLFVETSKNEECNLIGFTPVRNFEETEFDDLGPGSIGSALEIKKVEKAANGALLITVQGICRYENIGFLQAPEPYFNIRVRWFEDKEEPESLLRPQFERYLKVIERISRIAGERLKEYHNVSKNVPYHWRSAYFSSFLLRNDPPGWFTMDERIELFRLTSTYERLKRINERADKLLPYVENRERERRKGWFN
jgi:Lon protease-like protein